MAAVSSVVDTFTRLDPARWVTAAGTSATITAGQLSLWPAWTSGSSDLELSGELWSVAAYDLRGDSLTVEIPQTSEAASAVTAAALFTTNPRQNAVQWRALFDPSSAWGSQLQALVTVGYVSTVVATLRLDSQEYRHLRISENGGTVTWWTSPDGFVWTARGSRANPFTLSAVRIALSTWYESPGDAPTGGALFDNLNVSLGSLDVPTLTGDDGEPYLAVDVQPDVLTGVFRVGTSRVGGADRLAWSNDDPSTWVNVVCSVRTVDYQRGATRELGLLTTAEAGTATVVLEDTAGQFDPNTNSEAIRKGTPWRLRAWGTDADGARWDAVLFTGELDTLRTQYLPDEDAPLVTLTAVDLIGPLTAWQSEGLAGDGTGAGDNLLTRALRILGTVGRGEVSSASSTSYTATLAPTVLAKPWEELQQAAEAELGRLWVDKHNRLQLRARGSQPLGTVRGTLSDVHPAADVGVHQCMEDAQVVRGVEGMANRVIGRRRKLAADGVVDPVQARRDDELSQRLYGVASVNRSDLLLQTDAQVAAWAGALIVARTKPELRVESVTPRPDPDDLDLCLQQWPAVLSTDIGDRWLFQLHPRSGPPIARGVGVLGISVSITPDGWTVQWVTEAAAVPGAANPTGWFVVGTSMIGGGDALAPYPAPYAAA